MSSPKPQTIEHELFAQVHELIENESHDAFAIKRLEKAADKLASADAAAASILRSALTSLQWDLDGTHYWVDNALKNDRSPAIILNGCISYSLLSQFDSVVDLAKEAISMAPNNEDYVRQATEHLCNRGFFSRCNDGA